MSDYNDYCERINYKFCQASLKIVAKNYVLLCTP